MTVSGQRRGEDFLVGLDGLSFSLIRRGVSGAAAISLSGGVARPSKWLTRQHTVPRRSAKRVHPGCRPSTGRTRRKIEQAVRVCPMSCPMAGVCDVPRTLMQACTRAPEGCWANFPSWTSGAEAYAESVAPSLYPRCTPMHARHPAHSSDSPGIACPQGLMPLRNEKVPGSNPQLGSECGSEGVAPAPLVSSLWRPAGSHGG